MPIKVNESQKEFHLFNDKLSYIFRVMEKSGQLEQLYYGKQIRHRASFNHLIEREPRAYSTSLFEGEHTSSLEHIKQEYPSYGTTDFRMPAHQIEQANGSRITNFTYKGFEIFKGKPTLEGLPATYVEHDDEADTLRVTLEDSLLGCTLILSYTIYNEMGAICRSAHFINKGSETFYLDQAMSTSVDLPDSNYEMVSLTGAWGREAHVETRQLAKGLQAVYSKRGASSHVHNPFLALKRASATEHQGDVYGFSLVYSGNFLAQVEVDAFDVARVTMGIHPDHFKWKLAPGETFQTPECVMVYSDQGLNGMSGTYHTLYQNRLVRGVWRDRERPVLINNWEATYFDFNEERIVGIAGTAKALGVELFVLDDGWFGNRNDDTTSLGDWFVNYDKLKSGIKGLSEKVTALGMRFGLWFEPEMVSPNTKLMTDHPDWVIETPGRCRSHGRNQFILDFSRDEVVDHLFDLMNDILKDAHITYIKWDMNRSMTEPFSKGLPADQQGEFFHRYLLGVYRLYERLIEAYPEILFESCAGGGGRFDPGMLFYAPQGWISDDTDAVERLKIQYGTSMVYPLKSMGSHVSAVPNHQVGRKTSLQARGNVALFGTFGFELDLNTLTSEEKDIVRDQIAFFKENRNMLQNGSFYRLLSPFESNEVSWMVASADQTEAVVCYFKVLAKPNDKYYRVKLQGLDPEKKYRLEGKGSTHYGDELMNVGVVLSENYTGRSDGSVGHTRGDYASRLFVLKEVK